VGSPSRPRLYGAVGKFAISTNIGLCVGNDTIQDRDKVTTDHYRKSYMSYRTVPLAMTLTDFGGHFNCYLSP